MINEEILYSDSIYLGGRIVTVSDWKREFPDWYENWRRLKKEKALDDYFLISDYSYGISATINAVYSVDLEKATAEYLCSFECERNEGSIYHPPTRIGNVLLFAPCNAHRWAYYDLDMHKWSYEDIPTEYIQGEGPTIKASLWIPEENCMIYMLGKTNAMIKWDIVSGEKTYHDCFQTIRQNGGELLEFSSMTAYGDSVLLFINTGNVVYEIDTKTMQLTQTYKIPLKCEGVLMAKTISETDWIFLLENSQTSGIVKWDIKSGRIEEITDLPIHSKENTSQGPILGFGNDFSGLYIIPKQDKCVVKVDFHNNKAKRIELQTEMNLLDRKNEYYRWWSGDYSFNILTYNGYKNYVTVFLPYDFSIAEIDFDKGILLNKRKWKVSGIEKLIRKRMMHQVDGTYMENQFFGLREFVEDLSGKMQ